MVAHFAYALVDKKGKIQDINYYGHLNIYKLRKNATRMQTFYPNTTVVRILIKETILSESYMKKQAKKK